MRQRTWTPPDITQMKTLAERADRRLVESGDHLLDVLTESLDRFEGELHGELPAVSTLWDNLGDGRFRPKDEQELSDAVARHLRRDLGDRGVIAGREVVIRRGGAGGVPGQRTDLYVTAMPAKPAGGRDPISVIVEVKGARHDELLSAMETQLVGSYLARNPECRHSLYLVGWCLCDRWIDEPRKRKTRELGSVSALKDRLREQAGKLSLGGTSVRAVVVDAAWR